MQKCNVKVVKNKIRLKNGAKFEDKKWFVNVNTHYVTVTQSKVN